MYFDLSVTIDRAPEDVFIFLRDKDLYIQKPGSPVLILEKTTGGPTGAGTNYREVVQMLPFIRGEIFSEITIYDPPKRLEESFHSSGMNGYLAYLFLADKNGTKLIQRETLNFKGLLKLLHPLIRAVLLRKLKRRLIDIKDDLETENG